MTFLHRQLSLFLFAVAFLAWVGARPTTAQSVDAVVQKMEAQYQRQLSTVNTFIVETNHYVSYYEKTTRDGIPTYRSATRLVDDGDLSSEAGSFPSEGAPSTFYGFDFDRLREHARYGGTETIGGAKAHVLTVDNPAAFDPEMDKSTTRLTYYIEAERHLPVRMRMETKADRREGPASTILVDLMDYRTTDGLTLPHRMEMQLGLAMSEKERRQMQRMIEQLKAMPERQRKQMEKMMGDRMETITRMASGKPIVVEVQSVKVNVPIPEGIFADSSGD